MGGSTLSNSGVCECRGLSVYWDGIQCVKCEYPKHFDFLMKVCVPCKPEQLFNNAENRC